MDNASPAHRFHPAEENRRRGAPHAGFDDCVDLGFHRNDQMCEHPADQRLQGRPSQKPSGKARRVYRKLTLIGIYALTLEFAICGANPAFGQECPHENSMEESIASQVRTLKGRLIFHDGIRQWFELKLDGPQCGQSSIELVQVEEKYKSLEIFRGCRVATDGAIDFSPTSYYSLDTFQDVKNIKPVGTCSRQPPFRDYSGAKPDMLIHTYRVEMLVNYRSGDHPVTFDVRGAGKKLRP